MKKISAIGEVMHVVGPEDATDAQPSGMGMHLQEMDAESYNNIESFISAKYKKASDDAVLGRREHQRFESKIRVKFGSVEALKEEYTHNISHGGIFIRTKTPKALREKMSIILQHPGNKQEIILEGEVVRVVNQEDSDKTGHPIGMGVKFDVVDENTRKQLDSFINSDYVSGKSIHEN